MEYQSKSKWEYRYEQRFYMAREDYPVASCDVPCVPGTLYGRFIQMITQGTNITKWWRIWLERLVVVLLFIFLLAFSIWWPGSSYE